MANNLVSFWVADIGQPPKQFNEPQSCFTFQDLHRKLGLAATDIITYNGEPVRMTDKPVEGRTYVVTAATTTKGCRWRV